MSKLYIAITSEDFNNIFSTESVSPKTVYNLRKFGYSRFFSEKINGENRLLLFDKIPKNLDIKESFIESYPIFIELDETCINIRLDNHTNKESPKVISYSKTIYFSKDYYKFIFRNDNEKKIILSKSLQSSETKFIPKYEKSFITFEDLASNQFSESVDKRNLPPDSKVEHYQTVVKDIKINAVKGLLYGYLIGCQNTYSKEISQLFKMFRNIKNDMGALFNYIESYRSKKKSHKYGASTESKQINDFRKELITNIESINEIFHQAVPEQDLQHLMLAFIDSKGIDGDKNQFLENCRKIKSGRKSVYDIIEDIVVDSSPTFSTACTKFINVIINFVDSEISYSSNWQKPEEVKEIVDNLIPKLNGFIKEVADKKGKMPSNPDSFSFSDDFTITRFKGTSNQEVFSDIVNILLENNLAERPFIDVDAKIEIVNIIGKTLKDNNYYQDPDNCPELQFLRDLKKIIKGTDHSFNINSMQDDVLVGFATFIMKSDDLGKLIDFMELNSIDKKYIAICFWGAFNGLAKISKAYTEDLFKPENIHLIDQIDSIIEPLIKKETIKVKVEEVKQPETKIITAEIIESEQSEPKSIKAEIIETKESEPNTITAHIESDKEDTDAINTIEIKDSPDSIVQEPLVDYSGSEALFEVRKNKEFGKYILWIENVYRHFITKEKQEQSMYPDVEIYLPDINKKLEKFYEFRNNQDKKKFGSVKREQFIKLINTEQVRKDIEL